MFSAYDQGLLVEVCISVLLALSVFVVLSTGQLSLGNAGFMAIGAYLSAYATTAIGLPVTVAILIGLVASASIGVIVGFPALRLTGIYLAMATFGFGVVMQAVFQLTPAFGGAGGLTGMPPIGLATVLAWTIACLLFVYLLYRSGLWLGCRAIHDDEQVAVLTGVDATALKVFSFGTGGALAGVAGGLYAHWFSFVEPSTFSFLVSVYAVLGVVLGGRHSILGPVLGATVLTLLPEYARPAVEWRPAIVGILVIAILIVRPQGLIGERWGLLRGVRGLRDALRSLRGGMGSGRAIDKPRT